MTQQPRGSEEIAREIVLGPTKPGSPVRIVSDEGYILIKSITQALRSVRQEATRLENEACAIVLQNLGEMALNSEGNFRSAQWKICDEALTAIRNRLKDSERKP